MLIGLLILLFIVLVDLAALGGIITGLIMTTLRLRRSRPARPSAVAIRLWTSLIALAVGLGLLVLSNAWLVLWVNSSDDQGKPTQAQAVGTWTDSVVGGTATLRIFPDGTFTATGLPPDTDSSTGKDVTVRALPADEHGTWQITRGNGSWYVLCSLSGGPQFDFNTGPPNPLSALFTYVQGQFSMPTVWGFDRTSPNPEYRQP